MEPTYREGGDRSGLKKLIWLLLLALIVVAGALAYNSMNKKDDTATENNQSQNQSQQSGESTADLKTKFEADITEEERTVYYNANTSVEDPSTNKANLEKIATFYKDNEGAKLVVNGSVNSTPETSMEEEQALAKERADKVKQALVELGVSAEDIKVTTEYQFKQAGDTPAAAAAMARYLRSATISVE